MGDTGFMKEICALHGLPKMSQDAGEVLIGPAPSFAGLPKKWTSVHMCVQVQRQLPQHKAVN